MPGDQWGTLRNRWERSVLAGCVIALALVTATTTSASDPVAPEPQATPAVDYLRDIKPLLTQHCVKCHGPDEQKSGLRLDTAEGARTGGNSGPSFDKDSPPDSVLLDAVFARNGMAVMPPTSEKALSDAEKDLLRRWVLDGARAPDGETATDRARRTSDHWAFQPVKRTDAPEITDPRFVEWTHSPIDRFLAAELLKRDLAPSPAADRVTLLRRVSLDLIGLPPSPEEVAAFVADQSPDAYTKVVDRLLASPHYGERWGRHWLDAARYADSNGFTIDSARDIWKYRDWVVDALNRDLPFDRFTLEQFAGDLLSEATTDNRVATGFHRNTLINEEGGTDPEQFRVEAVVDRVGTTGTVFLGLSVGCAQCHDHKYDPISQREFYQFFAFLNTCDEPKIEVPTPEQMAADALGERTRIRAEIKRLEEQFKARSAEFQADLDAWELSIKDKPEIRDKLPRLVANVINLNAEMRKGADLKPLSDYYAALPESRAKYTELDEIAKLKAREPQFVTTLALAERKQPRDTHVHVRGDFLRKGAKVAPDTPEVLPAFDESIPRNRAGLAKWLVDARNPLTPRVQVNRAWLRFFGRGLVETDNDFGLQGTPPSHPALLDWLADEFVRGESEGTGAWSNKRLHRMIVTSAAYRQSSAYRADSDERDPNNVWLSRQNRVRLDAEIVRDAALAASGLLAPKLGGPPVYPPQPEGVYAFTQVNKSWPVSEGADRFRRAIYTYLWRSSPYPGLSVFDFPDANLTCTRRNRSNTPLQSLTLANDQVFVEFAQGLAQRVLREGPSDTPGRIRTAVRICLSREPTPAEETRLVEVVTRLQAAFASDASAAEGAAGTRFRGEVPAPEFAAWTGLARVLLNLDEFITRE
jgi:mono/diheme cytochrome c family protein